MILKTTTLLSLALCVLGDGHHAISEQRIKIHQTEHHRDHGDLKDISSNPTEHHEEYAWSYPSYEFSYKVHDPHTHDMKGHEETRHGDDVKGEYWLVQPDGQKRTVTYHVDKHSGFKATVKYSDHQNEKDDDGDDIKEGSEESTDGGEVKGGESEKGGEGGKDGEGEQGGEGGKVEEGGQGEEGELGGEEKDADEKAHEGDNGCKKDGEESRSQEGYRQAWAILRKEHGREEGRSEEGHAGDDRGYDDRRSGNKGRDEYGDIDIENMGDFGRRDSGRGRGRDHEEHRGWEERHMHMQPKGHQGHDTYNYPRFYRQAQGVRPRQ